MTVRPMTPERAVFAIGWLASVFFAYRAVRFTLAEERRRR